MSYMKLNVTMDVVTYQCDAMKIETEESWETGDPTFLVSMYAVRRIGGSLVEPATVRIQCDDLPLVQMVDEKGEAR